MCKRSGTFDVNAVGRAPDEIAWDVLDDIDEQTGTKLTEDAGKGFRSIKDVECIRETEKGLLVRIGGTNLQEWLPKSQIHHAQSEVRKKGDKGTLVVAAWWAKKLDEKDPLAAELADYKDAVEIPDVVVLSESRKALLVRLPAGEEREEWIPKGQIMPHSPVQHDGESGTLIVTGWIAREKKLP